MQMQVQLKKYIYSCVNEHLLTWRKKKSGIMQSWCLAVVIDRSSTGMSPLAVLLENSVAMTVRFVLSFLSVFIIFWSKCEEDIVLYYYPHYHASPFLGCEKKNQLYHLIFSIHLTQNASTVGNDRSTHLSAIFRVYLLWSEHFVKLLRVINLVHRFCSLRT